MKSRKEINKRSIWSGSSIAWALAVGLLVLLATTSFLKMRQRSRLDENIEEAQARAVDRAFQAIQVDFERLQQELVREARDLAEESELVASLERYTYSDDPASQDWLFRYFIDYTPPERGAMELYTAAPRLVAWKGYSLPMGNAPTAPDFLEHITIESINDAGVRQGLVAWQPVLIDGRPIGAVRVMRLVGVNMPVENQYLQSYNLSDTWRRMTGLPASRRILPVWHSFLPATMLPISLATTLWLMAGECPGSRIATTCGQ
jgi:hypothetical protein